MHWIPAKLWNGSHSRRGREFDDKPLPELSNLFFKSNLVNRYIIFTLYIYTLYIHVIYTYIYILNIHIYIYYMYIYTHFCFYLYDLFFWGQSLQEHKRGHFSRSSSFQFFFGIFSHPIGYCEKKINTGVPGSISLNFQHVQQ